MTRNNQSLLNQIQVKVQQAEEPVGDPPLDAQTGKE